MRVAITMNERRAASEFERTKAFQVFDIRKGRPSGRTVIDTSAGVVEEDLIYILQNEGIDTLLCTTITSKVQQILEQNQIKVVTGAKGNIRNILGAYLKSERMNRLNQEKNKE